VLYPKYLQLPSRRLVPFLVTMAAASHMIDDSPPDPASENARDVELMRLVQKTDDHEAFRELRPVIATNRPRSSQLFSIPSREI